MTRSLSKTFWICIATAIFLAVFPTCMRAIDSQAGEKRLCQTSEEATAYIALQVGAREPAFVVSVLESLPEATMEGHALLRYALEQDSGFVRWGFSSSKIGKAKDGEWVTFRFWLDYRSTKDEDDAARAMAADIAGPWQEAGLSDRQKVGKLADYIAANWSYDDSCENLTAYSTLTEHKGVCLGMVLGSQLILDELGIPSKAVNGKIISAKVLHIVLLVEIDDYWYYFDPVEFVGERPGSAECLKNYYADHFAPDPAFLTEAFCRNHPMGDKDLRLQV